MLLLGLTSSPWHPGAPVAPGRSLVNTLVPSEMTQIGNAVAGVGPAGATSRNELLTAIDVVRRAGERRVGHDVNRQRSDVGGPDHAPDWQLCS
jgi:hypothetical protein